MAFIHGKGSALALRDATNTWRDVSAYLAEVSVPFKADAAETTTFGKNAKTFIAGLRDTSMTFRGYWDATATTGIDAILTGLLGTMPTTGLYGSSVSVNGMVQFGPAGTGASTNGRYNMDAILTDYTIGSPVGGVVAVSGSFQISGLPTHDSLALVVSGTA